MAGPRDQAARIVRSEPEVDDSPARALQDTARREGDAPSSSPVAESPPTAAAPKSGKRKFVLIGVGALLAIVAVYFGVNYMLVGRYMISTDDAYVRANNSTLGARVAGHIAQIVPGDNVAVRAGDVVFRIDDGDYRIAVDAARAKIATQQATIDRIGRQIVALESATEQAKAQTVSAEAAAKRAQLDFTRQEALSTKGFASRATFEGSQAGRDQGAASVQAAQAAYESARDNVEVAKAQQQEARAQLAELQSSLAKAERDLAFTSVKAPVDGIFSNRIVNTGDFIQTGQRLANIVPLDGVFIDANFKETQLQRLKPGQKVRISVDAYGGREVDGVVESVSPAAGAVFTLLPPDNATGNFTKIVQRVPVRVRVPQDPAGENLLRAGMSVHVSVDTRSRDGATPVAAAGR